jgi:uncharacterized protein
MPMVRCPQCGRQTEFSGNEFRPFCSERCKLIDLGAWASGQYNIPGEPVSMSDEHLGTLGRNGTEEADN